MVKEEEKWIKEKSDVILFHQINFVSCRFSEIFDKSSQDLYIIEIAAYDENLDNEDKNGNDYGYLYSKIIIK